jgi:hypothetical protein
MAKKAFFDGLHRKLEWKQVLDPLEAGVRGRGKPVEERYLVEHHRQIRCKFKHEK